jgi:hypothetical protein
MPDSKHVTLTASAMTTVNLDSMYYTEVEIVNLGSSNAYATINGADPTVKGEDTIVVPANSWVRRPAPGGAVTVKVISVGAIDMSVAGI